MPMSVTVPQARMVEIQHVKPLSDKYKREEEERKEKHVKEEEKRELKKRHEEKDANQEREKPRDAANKIELN